MAVNLTERLSRLKKPLPKPEKGKRPKRVTVSGSPGGPHTPGAKKKKKKKS